MNRISQRISYFLAYFLMGCGLVLFIAFGLFCWPNMHWDGALYTTPILNLANGYGWRFGSYTSQLVLRDSDEYSIHGVLYPIVFGILLRVKTYKDLFFWSGVVNAATFVAYTFIFHRNISKLYPRLSILMSISWGLMAGFLCLQMQGRPEHLTALIALFPVLMREFLTSFRFYAKYFAYATTGALFILSPVQGIIYGMGVTWYLVREKNANIINEKSFWKDLIIHALLSALFAVLMIETFCDFSFAVWIKNILQSKEQVPKDFFRLVMFYKPPQDFVWNWLIIAIFIIVFINLIQRKKVILMCLFFCLGIYILPNVQVYSLAHFLPLFIFAIVSQPEKIWAKATNVVKRRVAKFTTAIPILYSMFLLRCILLFLVYLQHGTSLATAKTMVQILTRNLEPEQCISYIWFSSQSPFVLSEAPDFFVSAETSLRDQGVDTTLEEYERKFNKTVRYIIVPEEGHLKEPPNSIQFLGRTYSLVYDGWKRRRARFLEVNLGGSVPGYHFSVYEYKINNENSKKSNA